MNQSWPIDFVESIPGTYPTMHLAASFMAALIESTLNSISSTALYAYGSLPRRHRRVADTQSLNPVVAGLTYGFRDGFKGPSPRAFSRGVFGGIVLNKLRIWSCGGE